LAEFYPMGVRRPHHGGHDRSANTARKLRPAPPCAARALALGAAAAGRTARHVRRARSDRREDRAAALVRQADAAMAGRLRMLSAPAAADRSERVRARAGACALVAAKTQAHDDG